MQHRPLIVVFAIAASASLASAQRGFRNATPTDSTGKCPAGMTEIRPRLCMAAGVGVGQVMGVGARPVSRQLANDLCAAGLGVFPRLQHEHSRPFAHQETVARRIERACRRRGTVAAV